MEKLQTRPQSADEIAEANTLYRELDAGRKVAREFCLVLLGFMSFFNYQ